MDIWVSSKYWSHSTRTHGITFQENVILLLLSYFSHSLCIVSSGHLNLHQTLFLYSVRVLLRSPQHRRATFNGPLGLHAWPSKLHRLTSPLSQTRCFECNPRPPSFIVRSRGALWRTFIDNNNNINSFWFVFYFIGNCGDDVWGGTWRNPWSKTFGWRGKSKL